MIYERLVRPGLFRLGDAEVAHNRTLRALGRLGRRPAVARALRRWYGAGAQPVTVAGIDFPSRVGVAAGLDKHGVALDAWPALGFGFVEVGTVTAQPQPGNPQPRMFRLKASEAIINRMGFNNAGAQALADRLVAGKPPVPLGISLGKSKAAPLDGAIDDYLASAKLLAAHADYLAINVSSPNTPGLRALQDRSHLDALLEALRAATDKPLFVKLAPDLTEAAIDEALEVCHARDVAGIIATNTTLARDGIAVADQTVAAEAGGLSGHPLTVRAREVVSFIAGRSKLPLIGVGGIMRPDDGRAMIDAGASLIQVYTGLIYHGPALIRRLHDALRS